MNGLVNNLKPRMLPVSKSQTAKKSPMVIGNTLNCLVVNERD